MHVEFVMVKKEGVCGKGLHCLRRKWGLKNEKRGFGGLF